MSNWTHVFGTIETWPLGRTQAEKTYVLETALSHLPLVTGSEGVMQCKYHISQSIDSYSRFDEFSHKTELAREYYLDIDNDMFCDHDRYVIMIDARLRDRTIDITLREFTEWLCRLAKRVFVADTLVRVSGEYDTYVFDDPDFLSAMYVGGARNWCEYLLWEKDPSTKLPRKWVESK